MHVGEYNSLSVVKADLTQPTALSRTERRLDFKLAEIFGHYTYVKYIKNVCGQGTSVDWVHACLHHSMIHSLNAMVLK